MRASPLVLLATGCALTRASTPREIRVYSPELMNRAPLSAPAAAPCGSLALGRVTGADHLRYRIVHRRSPVEVALYETLRWTEHPDVYVRRALVRHLFEAGGLRQATQRGGLALEVDVLAFEQSDRPAGGRVQLAYRLRDDREVIASGVVTSEHLARAVAMDAVVEAIGVATDAATAEIHGRIGPLVRARESCGSTR